MFTAETGGTTPLKRVEPLPVFKPLEKPVVANPSL